MLDPHDFIEEMGGRIEFCSFFAGQFSSLLLSGFAKMHWVFCVYSRKAITIEAIDFQVTVNRNQPVKPRKIRRSARRFRLVSGFTGHVLPHVLICKT